jgi:hypothetical protein
MKNSIIWLLTTLVLLLMIYVYYNSLKEKARQPTTNIIDNTIGLVNLYKSNFEVGLTDNHIDLSNLTVTDSTNQYVSLSSIINSPKIVFRFSEWNCKECVIHFLDKLKQFSDTIGKEHLIIISSFVHKRDINSFKIHAKINELQIFNTVKPLNFQSENYARPFFFMIDSTLRTFNVFIPDLYEDEITDNYLRVLVKNYFIDTDE